MTELPPNPRREVAQEFYTMARDLGVFARDQYLAEVRNGTRECNFTELRELEENIKVVEAELAKYQ